MSDIARQAGIHVTTVSQILNRRSNCWASEATRRHVMKLAGELGYRPNLAARSLRSGRSHVIGYISPGFGTGSPNSRAMGLTDTAMQHDYTVIVSSHPNDSESEDRLIRRLADRSMDGLVIYPADKGPHTELRRLVNDGFPVVTLDGSALLDFECDDISPDYQQVGRLQVRHLLETGRRRIGLIDPIPTGRINVIRDQAIRDLLAREGLPPPLELQVAIEDLQSEFVDAEPLVTGIRACLETQRGCFDALISHDTLASLAARILMETGCRIPGDVSVMGAGNSILAIYGLLPLTSISTADDQAGALAFGLLMDRMKQKRANLPFRRIVSPSNLIVRSSTIRT